MTSAECLSATAVSNVQGKQPRARSAGKKRVQRKKVEAEVHAKTARNKDIFALQQCLLPEAACESLMLAARGLFQPEDYEAVVEERRCEGLCGYPPCSNAALGDQGRKQFGKARDCTADIGSADGNFCSVACRRASAAFVVSLEPEPSYVRTEAVVAASRAAVAGEANTFAKEDEPKKLEVTPETSASKIQQKAEETPGKPTPKIRQKAVVKFSHVSQTYSVQCNEYDGGGGIPGFVSAEGDDVLDCPQVERGSSHENKKENKKEWIRRLVSTPVVERPKEHTTEAILACPVVADNNENQMEPTSCLSQSRLTSNGSSIQSRGTSKQPSILGKKDQKNILNASPCDEDQDDADVDNDLFSHFSPLEVPFNVLQPKSVSVRAWGVLASWVHDRARAALWRGIVPDFTEQDERPDHATRQQLLSELLLQRIPGDLAFLAPRFLQVVSAFQLHDTLPPVTDVLLYDLLAALILRAVLRADVSRKIRAYCQREETILCRQVEDAAARCGMHEDELGRLEKQLDFLYWS